MQSFVRFVFTILIVGMLVNLTVVFLANIRSQSRQSAENQRNKELLQGLLDNFDKRLRRADIVVESQRIDHANSVIESTLLVRQYHSTGSDQSQPLPIERIVIPGDRLSVYGMTIEFNSLFAEDAPDYRILRDKKLAYFAMVCGESEKPLPLKQDERFSFMQRGMVPELTRIDVRSKLPTIYETQLWKYIWERVPDELRDLPWSTNWNGSVNATFMKPASAAVQLRHGYSAWISTDGPQGSLSIEEDPLGGTGLTKLMTDQMKQQEAAALPALIAPD